MRAAADSFDVVDVEVGTLGNALKAEDVADALSALNYKSHKFEGDRAYLR